LLFPCLECSLCLPFALSKSDFRFHFYICCNNLFYYHVSNHIFQSYTCDSLMSTSHTNMKLHKN
jgi:hypothetical protein